MKTLNINVIYDYNKNVVTSGQIEYKVYISFNKDNQSIYVFTGYTLQSGYTDLIDFALNSVLEYTETSVKDYSTIDYNVINFDF